MRCDECIKYAEVCYACGPVRKLESIIGDNGAKPTLCDGWRDARECLPEYFEEVLIYFIKYGKTFMVTSQKTADGEMMCNVFLFGRNGCVEDNKIIAWMPVSEIAPPAFA